MIISASLIAIGSGLISVIQACFKMSCKSYIERESTNQSIEQHSTIKNICQNSTIVCSHRKHICFGFVW